MAQRLQLPRRVFVVDRAAFEDMTTWGLCQSLGTAGWRWRALGRPLPAPFALGSEKIWHTPGVTVLRECGIVVGGWALSTLMRGETFPQVIDMEMRLAARESPPSVNRTAELFGCLLGGSSLRLIYLVL